MMILDLFMLRDTPYRHALESSRAPLWLALFLIGTGASYGALVAYFQQALAGELQGVSVTEIPNAILYGGNVLSGILAAMTFHGGVTLLLWLMAKAVGGPGRLGAMYRTTSYAMPLTLFALPFLAADSAAAGADISLLPLAGIYQLIALVSAVMLLIGLYRMVRVTQGVSPRKAASAVALFTLFCASILFVS